MAVGRLHELRELAKSWTQAMRVRWGLRAKELLWEGDADGLLAHCALLAKGSRAKKAKSLMGYFQEHRDRIQYADFERRKIPRGSGAVESAIKQVLHMRLKGCGKFWKRENAEQMLLLRGWQVCGRLEDLWMFALRRRVGWWYDALGQHPCGSERVAA